tara:strand:- start:65 stop:391 length:327 start_codon:yes stop_codon:yes gene_type:complete
MLQYIHNQREREFQMTKTNKNLIDYLYASNGGIVFCSGSVLNQVGFAKSAKVAAYVLETKGIADEIRHSSSMDFAAEEGFKKNGDAWVMFDTALEMIGLDYNIGCRAL